MALRAMWSAMGKLGVVVAIMGAFAVGLAGTIYLSLRSPEVQVPKVVGQNLYAARETLERAGLKSRERARRYKSGVKPDEVVDQSPRDGEVVKEGQTVAIVVSREAREGESTAAETPEATPSAESNNSQENRNGATDSTRNENQNKEPRNKNANKNKNSNKNTNANNKNANNSNNQNGNRNTNNRNANANRNSNANRNADNRNANDRNGNGNANRNVNRNATNTRNTNTVVRNSNNANRRVP